MISLSTSAEWLFFESSSRSISLFEHDLRANASRLSRGKTGTHPRIKSEGMFFRIMLQYQRAAVGPALTLSICAQPIRRAARIELLPAPVRCPLPVPGRKTGGLT